jgi:hypothetical protein
MNEEGEQEKHYDPFWKAPLTLKFIDIRVRIGRGAGGK